jgi:ParB family transcriptional regulator, chromosome partitioning protein
MPKLQDLATKVKAQVASEQNIVEQRFATAEKIFLGKDTPSVPTTNEAEDNTASAFTGTLANADAPVVPSALYAQWCRDHQYREGDTIELSIDVVDDNPYNPRRIYREDSIQRLAVNMAAEGQQQPVHVTLHRREPGRFVLLDGKRRKMALQTLGRKHVRAIVVDKSAPKDFYNFARHLNTERDSQTVFDDALAWKDLLATGAVQDQVELAAMVKQSPTAISMTLALADLPSALMEFMAGSPARFGMRMAYEIFLYHKHFGLDPALKLAERILSDDLSVRDVERLRKRTAAQETEPPKRHHHRYDHRYELHYRGAPVGVVKTYNTGELEVRLTGFTVELQERFAQRLSEVMQEFDQ